MGIDTQYYLSQQLHPVVSRLTEPIEGMEGARVAACLGLDPDQYKSRAPVDQLVVSCVCGEKCKLLSPTQGKGRAEKPSLAKCPAAKDCGGYPLQREGFVAGAIDLLVRKSLAKYYAGWLVCEDPGSSGRTRCLPL